MKETIRYVDRLGSNCSKWDRQEGMYGENGLLGMWVADMDFQVPEAVREAVHRYADFGVFGYTSPAEGYFEAFIDWERERHGYTVKKEWLRFSPGVVPAFNWWVQIKTRPSDAVIVLSPVYYPFLHAVKGRGRKLVCCDLKCEDGRYSIDFEAFESLIREHQVKAFILCSPHNPVSRVWTKEELQRLLEICRRHGVFVISDEIHHDLTFNGHTHLPTATVGDYDDMLVTLTAPSKTFNLAGLKNAFVIVPDEGLRAEFDAFTKQINVTGGNAVGYLAAEAAYRRGGDWYEQIRDIIWGNYCYAAEALKEALPELVISPLEGTYLMWINFGAYLKPEEIRDFFQKKCRIAVDYGEWFGGDAATCVRVNLATSRENVAECVRRIAAALQA